MNNFGFVLIVKKLKFLLDSEEVKNFCVYHFEETNLSLQDGLMTKLATVHRQSAQAKPCNTVV